MGSAHQYFLSLPPAELKLIRERNLELARPTPSEKPAEILELLEIQSGAQRFALPLDTVQGVAELTSLAPVPCVPPAVRGIVTFRGELLLAVELSALVGPPQTGFADLRRIIALSSKAMRIAILGEKVLSVRSASKNSFCAEPSSHPFVAGVDQDFLSLLDPELLVARVRELLSRIHG